jgi:hypothetical protein
VPCGQTDRHDEGNVIPSFRRDVDENYALLGYYASSGGNSLLTIRDNLLVPSSRIKELPLLAPSESRRAQFSS